MLRKKRTSLTFQSGKKKRLYFALRYQTLFRFFLSSVRVWGGHYLSNFAHLFAFIELTGLNSRLNWRYNCVCKALWALSSKHGCTCSPLLRYFLFMRSFVSCVTLMEPNGIRYMKHPNMVTWLMSSGSHIVLLVWAIQRYFMDNRFLRNSYSYSQ